MLADAWFFVVSAVQLLSYVALVWWFICVVSMWRIMGRIAKATQARGELLEAQAASPIPS